MPAELMFPRANSTRAWFEYSFQKSLKKISLPFRQKGTCDARYYRYVNRSR